jgi:DNA-binding HxlR family transcriptional regulator
MLQLGLLHETFGGDPSRLQLRHATRVATFPVSMLKRDYANQDCSIARALEVVGERWTLLIVRDLFLGRTRFDQIQESLGVARNVLSDRLVRLVEHGIVEKVRYSERPERFEYRLTAKGRDLHIALAGLRQWGDRYLAAPRSELRRRSDGRRVIAGLVAEGDELVGYDDVEIVRVPARASSSAR